MKQRGTSVILAPAPFAGSPPLMPQTARAAAGGFYDHVLNRCKHPQPAMRRPSGCGDARPAAGRSGPTAGRPRCGWGWRRADGRGPAAEIGRGPADVVLIGPTENGPFFAGAAAVAL